MELVPLTATVTMALMAVMLPLAPPRPDSVVGAVLAVQEPKLEVVAVEVRQARVLTAVSRAVIPLV